MRQLIRAVRPIVSIRYMESHVLTGVMVALIVVPLMFKV
jgi:hypothetical protein